MLALLLIAAVLVLLGGIFVSKLVLLLFVALVFLALFGPGR